MSETRTLTKGEAEQLGAVWAEWNSDAKRAQVVHAMLGAGLSKNRIHTITGIARTTIDRVLDQPTSDPAEGAAPISTPNKGAS